MPKYPFILQTQYYIYIIAVILSLSKVILLYSCCAKKGLVYVAIAAPSGYQFSSCSKCTSANIRSSYNV